MADNYLDATVNPRTGELSISITPPKLPGVTTATTVDLGVRYQQSDGHSDESILGLPPGWRYRLSYIAGNRIFINGAQTYALDPQKKSGMRYYDLKATKLDSYGFGSYPTLPYDKSEQYAWKLQFLDGQNQYFDNYGRLIASDDKNGNHVLYYYDVPDHHADASRIERIVDSFGQTILLAYSTDSIQIIFPQGGSNRIQFSYLTGGRNAKLAGYIDPGGETTKIEYGGGNVNTGLISKITYPNQLSKSYSYSTIDYLSPGGTTLQQDVVSSATSTFQGKSRSTKYDFAPGGNRKNYLGFPDYKTSGGRDILFETGLDSYRYRSHVDDGVTTTIHTYNRLHLRLQKEVLSSEDQSTIRKTTYTYSGEGAEAHFPPYNQLPPNYQTPTEVVTEFFDETGNSRTQKTKTAFNDYGQPCDIIKYESTAGSKQLSVVKETSSTYDPRFGLVVAKEIRDYKPGGTVVSTPSVSKVANTLTADGRHILTSQQGQVAPKSGKFLPEKEKSFAYDPQGRITSNILSWSDGSNNNPGPQKTEVKVSYKTDPSKRILIKTKTDDEGNESTKAIDTTTGFVLQREDALCEIEKLAYDNLGRILCRTDPLGNHTKYIYDTAGGKATTQHANGYITYAYYNGFGDRVGKSDNLGPSGEERVLEARDYDPAGRLASVSGILGSNSKLTYEYNPRGLLAKKTDALGNQYFYTYDSVARTRTTWFNKVKIKTETYDENRQIVETGYPLSTGDGGEATKLSRYDSNRLKVYAQAGTQTQGVNWTNETSSYDLSNKLQSRVKSGWDGVQKTEAFVRDLFNKVVSSERQLQDKNGPLTTATSSTLKRNGVGLLVEEVNPLEDARTYRYDPVGNMKRKTDFDGTEIDYCFDAIRRVTKMNYEDADGCNVVVSYTYEEGSNLLKSIQQTRDGSHAAEQAYSYTLDGKLESTTYPDGKVLQWCYDPAHGRLDHTIDACGNKTQYSYDKYGRVVKIAMSDYSVTLSYLDPKTGGSNSGQIASLRYSNGTHIRFSYNQLHLPKTIVATDASGGELMTVSYGYDLTRSLATSIAYSSGVIKDENANYISNYTYNSIGRLTGEIDTSPDGKTVLSATSYTYDAADNVISKSVTAASETTITNYCYDTDNKLVSITVGDKRFVQHYDKRGNMEADGFGNTYSYNALNQLVAFKDAAGIQTAYTYYPNGLRESKVIGGAQPVVFYYDHSKNPNIINEIQGDVCAGYLMLGNQRFVRLLQRADGTAPEYIIQDRKNVLLVIDQEDNPLAVYNFDAYGEGRSFSGDVPSPPFSISDNPFKYSKQYQDSESGLYYLRSRYYDPRIMRFINRDSIQIFNHFSYADADPVMFSDRSGHAPWWNYLVSALVAIASVAVTILTAGAAAPAAAAADTAEIGGAVAADVGSAAGVAAETGSTAAEAGASLGSEEAAESISSNLLDGFGGNGGGIDGTGEGFGSPTNPNNLTNNCVFCTAGHMLKLSAPEVAQSLGLEEGVVGSNEVGNLFSELNLSETGEFDVVTRDPAEAFDYMANQPEGSRFAFGYRSVNSSVGHFVAAESEGPGNAVSIFDAQAGSALFGDPGASVAPTTYYVLGMDPDSIPTPMDWTYISEQ